MTLRPLLALAVGAWAMACGGSSSSPDSDRTVESYRNLPVGLNAAERLEVRHLSEGSDLFPVVLLFALEDSFAGKPFIDSMERFGFLPSESSEANSFGLPVGWMVDTPDLSPNRLPYAGINCAACHSGQIEYQGERMRIDGAPNMVDLEAFGQAIRDSLVATLLDAEKTLEMIQRAARALHPDLGEAALLAIPGDTRRFLENLRASVEDEDEESSPGDVGDEELATDLAAAIQRLLRGESASAMEEASRVLETGASADRRRHVVTLLELVERFGPIVENRVGFALRAIHAIDTSPAAGPGRDDAWGVIRNLVFETPTRLDGATSIPDLFGLTELDWYHADGNTNSVLQRNVAQAVALGAYVDLETGESTLIPRAIHRLETLWAKVRAPAWPEEVLGEIDPARVSRGAVLFATPRPGSGGRSWSCADCHALEGPPLMVDLEVIGTDRNRANNFARPIDGRPFAREIVARVEAVIDVALAKAGIGRSEARSWEYFGTEASSEAQGPQWRTTRMYAAKPLDGIWATAPYLHNGSVPTLHHLLMPASERPESFPLGHREYDPERVGYTLDVLLSPFLFDVSVDGNSNAGHEFGTDLTDDERRDLIEYLKTL